MFPPTADVRMKGFRHRTEVAAVWQLLDARIQPLTAEAMPLAELTGRVLAEAVTATIDLPPFDRSAMDGFALRGEETFGAGPFNPLIFTLVGEAFPGRPIAQAVEAGQAVRIMTGAPLPPGADTVVPAELAQEENGRVAILEPMPPGRHISHQGEDFSRGCPVLPAGRQLRPQDVAVLAALGHATIQVFRQPQVAIISTGNELLPPGQPPLGTRIVDSNSLMLAALVRRDGGKPTLEPIVPDEKQLIREALGRCTGYADLILVSGGSSVGQEDHAPLVVAELGELAVHGVAMRPASPTGIGFLSGIQGATKRAIPVFLLPGNPVSCLAAYDFFAGRAVRMFGGRRREWPYPSQQMLLAGKIVSALGRVDYVRGCILADGFQPLAVSGAALLSTTTRADGFVIVDQDSEGAPPGALVTVWRYDL
jgi:molybdopterin molybdotransferase